VAVEAAAAPLDALGRGAADVDSAHGLLCAAAIGAGDARDGETARGARDAAHAFGHGPGHRLAHRAVGAQEMLRPAQELLLGPVRVHDDPPLDVTRPTHHGSQPVAEEAASAPL